MFSQVARSRSLSLLGIVLPLVIASIGNAQVPTNESQAYRIQPPIPAWVKHHPLPESEHTPQKEGGILFLLESRQDRITDDGIERHYHRARKFLSPPEFKTEPIYASNSLPILRPLIFTLFGFIAAGLLKTVSTMRRCA